jgi:hypothetical protein
MDILPKLKQQVLTKEQLLQIICDFVGAEAGFSSIDMSEVCRLLYNHFQKIDTNSLFGDDFVCMVQKMVNHFSSLDISREMTILILSIFCNLSIENCDVLLEDESMIKFIIKFMKWKGGGQVFVNKYYLIAMRISVIHPKLIPTFIEHMDIQKIKKMVGNNDNSDRETFFLIYNWIYHISSQPCGIQFILKEPEYFTKILCELVKKTTLQIFFQKAVFALENILYLDNPIIRELIRSELKECVPNMTKGHFPDDLEAKWEDIRKSF